MKMAGIARNVLIVALAWRVIAQRRYALARDRRARRIAPLLIAAGGTGALLATRPRTLELARRLRDAARLRWSGKTNKGASEQPGTSATVGVEPRPSPKKRRKRNPQSKRGTRKSAYALKAGSEERPAASPRIGESEH